ncbi:unnamed protein product, partial [Arabidopsis halleri]
LYQTPEIRVDNLRKTKLSISFRLLLLSSLNSVDTHSFSSSSLSCFYRSKDQFSFFFSVRNPA